MLGALSTATAQNVEGVALDTLSVRTHEEQILPREFNIRLGNTNIQYEHDKARPNWGYEENRLIYRAILKVVKELASSSEVVRTIVIEGGASPVGTEQYNHDLAHNRAKILRQWVAGMNGGEKLRIYAISAGEDWTTFAQQIHEKYHNTNRKQVLAIINSDCSNDEKERKLYRLDSGKTWKLLVDEYMAPARNAAVVRIVENEPLASYTRHPLFKGEVRSAELTLPYKLPIKVVSPVVVPAVEPTVQTVEQEQPKVAPQPKAEPKQTAEKVVTPKVPKAEKVVEPKPEKVVVPKTKKVAEPKAEKVATPKAEKVVEPKPEKEVAPKAEKPAKEVIVKEKQTKEITIKEVVAKEKPTKEPVVKEKKEKPVKVKEPIVVEPRIPIMAFRSNLLVPALNAGIEVPIGNHWSVGADYYFPWIWPKKDNKNCFELLGWGIEGRYWFGKERTAYDRLKGHSVGLYGYMGYYDFERNFHGHQGEFVNVGVDYTYAMAVGKRKALHLEFSLGLGYIYSEARKYTVIEANGPLISDKITKKVGYFGPTKANVSLVVPIFQKVKPSNKIKGNE